MPITADAGTSRKGERLHYYKCSGRRKHNGCKKITVKKEALEEFITNTLIKEICKPEFINPMVEILFNMQSNRDIFIAKLLKERKQVQMQIDNIIAAVEQGIYSSSTKKRLRELDKKINELEKEIKIEEKQQDEILTKKDIKEFFQKAVSLSPEYLIIYLIKEIVLYDDKAEIYFNSPIIKTDPNNGPVLHFTNSYSTQLTSYTKPKTFMIEIYV